ncbi:hypothetical protein BDZ97DRAFT_1661795 [Flammula alnicola]|nr:hypothetical protein BDZ97DRAFT_1661795 [Flammula alnicola]
MDTHGVRIPPILASLGQACYQCYREKGEAPLHRCGGCLRVYYCGSTCQKANWSKHKGICKTMKAVESKHGSELLVPFKLHSFILSQVGNVELVNEGTHSVSGVEVTMLERELKRPLSLEERNLVGWQPRCLACGRTDLMSRLEASEGQQSPHPNLKPCPDCKISFYCSEDHCRSVESTHQGVPCQGSRNGLSHCAMNQLYLQDARFALFMAGANGGPFKWAPERTKPSWTSLRNIDWTDFSDNLKKAFGPAVDRMAKLETVLRGVTEGLSMPMTILYALENLNTDDAWTKKDTINIHVSLLDYADIFEEILHRLPDVNNIRLTFCGPELSAISGRHPAETEMDTCPECSRKKRKRIQDIQPSTYHEFVASQGRRYVKPDLAVAFNSGCSEEDVSSWKTTLVLLAQRNVPTIFTAYNQEEAQAEAKILESAGAILHADLGPKQNPWGSLLAKTEPNKVTGFYAVNGWLAGGFK